MSESKFEEWWHEKEKQLIKHGYGSHYLGKLKSLYLESWIKAWDVAQDSLLHEQQVDSWDLN